MSLKALYEQAFGCVHLSAGHIASLGLRYQRKCGIYFLISAGEVIYVGQSINIESRLAEHEGSKEWDSFHWVPCPEAHLDLMESLYIHILKPKRNSTDHGRGVPIRLKHFEGGRVVEELQRAWRRRSNPPRDEDLIARLSAWTGTE